MKKPIQVEHYEFEQKLVELINKSDLPAFVIEGVLRELIPIVQKNAQMELASALKGEADDHNQNVQAESGAGNHE